MDRKGAITIYLLGTIGQILLICMAVYLQRSNGMKVDYTTLWGMIAVGIGGVSSALWGIVIAVTYKRDSLKEVLLDFVNIKQSYKSYFIAFLFLIVNFCYVLFGGMIKVNIWYIPILLFFKAIIFGGIEEFGWRYTFQPILEEKLNYVSATLVTFVMWGIWHFLYFYIEGTLEQVEVKSFLLGLFTNCFILSALYAKTKSLWICVMSHALINVFSQISIGGNIYVLSVCRVIIIISAIFMVHKSKLSNRHTH